MNRRDQRIVRIKEVEREYRVGVLAIETLRRFLARESGLLARSELRMTDLNSLEDGFEATFHLRLFAEFEAGLREVWLKARKRTTVPKTEDLVDALANWRRVPEELLHNVHSVRKFRNTLIHEVGSAAELVISINAARGWLCQFLARMPVYGPEQ